MKKGKVLLIVILIVIIVAGVVGAFMWNKAPDTVDDKPSVSIAAEVLSKAFEHNEQQANATYLNKALTVNGTISELDKNQDGKTVVILQSEDPMSGVQCTMRDDVTFEVGAQVTIKGFCNGYTTVVLLSDCIVAQSK